MLKWLKFLPLAGLGKDVSTAYKEQTGKDRPKVLSRRVIGAAIAFISAFVAIKFGVTLDATIIAQITESLDKLVVASTTLYGLALLIYGYFKRKKEVKQ